MERMVTTCNLIYPTLKKCSTLTAFFLVFLTSVVSAQITLKPDDRGNYAKEVQAFFEKDNWEGGKDAIVKGLIKYPKDSDLKMLYGKYYLHYKQYEKARYELMKSLEYNPDNVEAKHIMVNVEMESGRYSSAICYVNELLEVNPYYIGLWRKKIQLFDMQGNIVEANRLRKRISQIYPNDGEVLKDYMYSAELQAIQNRKDEKYDESISLSKELINQYPNSAEFYLDIINDYLKVGDRINAQVYIERGLNKFPGNIQFINKKIGLLALQKRNDELLSFLQEQIKKTNYPSLRQQYNYYLLEAAKEAKSKDPAVLYGQVLERNPGDTEAFSYVFNTSIANLQYEEALRVLNRYRSVKGDSKSLSIKELMVYQRMGNTVKATAVTKKIFEQYPGDADLKDAYANIMFYEAKRSVSEASYTEAIQSCNLVKQYGDEDMYKLAQNLLYSIYMEMGDYNNALITLNEIMEPETAHAEQYVRRAEIYVKQNRYIPGLIAYEYAIKIAPEEDKNQYLGGYSEMVGAMVKEKNEEYAYEEAMQLVDRWLVQDPNNQMALRYAVNLSYILNQPIQMREYTQRGISAYSNDVFFKIKMAEIRMQSGDSLSTAYSSVHYDVKHNRYNKDLLNVFVEVSQKYSERLVKEKKITQAIAVLDTALYYVPSSWDLKYAKGLAFEKKHQYDSAFYYQSFYKPGLAEIPDFQQHLDYLQNKAYKNEFGYSYLRSRHGDEYSISTISSIHYSRIQGRNTFVSRINYAGRDLGAGLQFQLGWAREWTAQTRTSIDAAWSFRYFPKLAANGSIYWEFDSWDGFEAELGMGYRRLPLVPEVDLTNLVIGATMTGDPWRFNMRFNTFLYSKKYLYSISANLRHTLSAPKNYISAVASVGSSPDVELIDAQFYNGFEVFNTMLGAGFGHLISKNVTAGCMGNWYNYKVGATTYKNFYTLLLSIDVAF